MIVRAIDGSTQRLGPRLTAVAAMLAENGPVASWRLAEMLDVRWPGGDYDMARVYVMRLRRKLGGPETIRTNRGVGYELTDAGRQALARLEAA